MLNMQKLFRFFKALEFAKDFRISHFELEGDALCVINRINSRLKDHSMTGQLIQGLRVLIKDFPSVKISHVERNLNRAAHE